MRKSLLLIIIMIIVFVITPTGAKADEHINIYYDGEILESDVEPVIEDGRVLVPIRVISETFGLRAEWSPSAKVVHVFGDDNFISVSTGGNIAYINEEATELDIAAKLVNGRAMVPIRFVAEAFSLNVKWEQNQNAIIIKDKQRYYDEILALLKQGNLHEARKLALLAPKKISRYGSDSKPLELDKAATYYFPEGECLSFYVQNEEQIKYLEEINGIFVIQWEANLGGAPMENPESTLTKYFATQSKGYTDEQGIRPLLTDPLTYFQFIPEDALIKYGKISEEGEKQELGSEKCEKDISAHIIDVPDECLSEQHEKLLGVIRPPGRTSYYFSSEMPLMELNEIEKREIEKDWEENNFYTIEEMRVINRHSIDYPLRTVYMLNWVTSTELSEDEQRFKEEYDKNIACFSDEIMDSQAWTDFLSMEILYDPSFGVMRAKSAEDYISATITGNRFHFGVVPVVFEIEMVKEGDKWIFTSIEDVRTYETIWDMHLKNPELYEEVVRIYNYFRKQSIYIF